MTDPAEHAYAKGSQFESCPAATGEAKCPQFPDGAHRCGLNRKHLADDPRPAVQKTHRCTCEQQWCSLMGSVDALIDLSVQTALRCAIAVIDKGERERRSGAADWAETARDLVSDDPERIARHLPLLRGPGESPARDAENS